VAALTVLDREMYTEPQAARLLRLAPSTLHYWLEGGARRNKTYKLGEAGLLRQYRQDLQVPMLELRNFIQLLRDRFDVPYPLAHQLPYVAERKLVVEAQDEAHLGADFALVAPVSGQYMLLPAAQAFYDRVTWADDTAQQWRPDDRSDSPVTIDPDMRFGSPSIGGISTAILFEQSESGEDEEDLAETFGLSLAQVRWALSYELANHAA
jgi:uncharacterized protein (DUF433 family)